MSKFTPGPWIAPKDQVNLVCTKRDWEDPQLGALAKAFQCTVSLNQGEKQAEANANLIAAAPELFDALEKAYLQILEFLNEGNFKRDIEFNADYIVNALAKARGGSDK